MASKAFLRNLQKGQILRVTVEEVNSDIEILCSLRGELLLVSNHTGLKFKKGDTLRLQVKSIDPLRFQIFDSRSPKFERVV